MSYIGGFVVPVPIEARQAFVDHAKINSWRINDD
jgi:uncharacterized protein YbaA (DUF1428 family)